MSPVHPDDRPSWLPEPPRLPAWFVRRFPVTPGQPPKDRKPRRLLDFVAAGVGGALLMAAMTWGLALLWILGVAAVLYAVWLDVLYLLSEQQITDWVNQRPESGDVPEVERPNG